MLSASAVKDFYDRFGARQDKQGFYEDSALDELCAHASFADAGEILEFGCGTGRFARRILTEATAATYLGLDVSTTMVGLARSRLASFGSRARVRQTGVGSILLPVADRSADRIVSTYVLDLLPDTDIRTFFEEARRVAAPEARLCLVSLTHGAPGLARVVSGLWERAFRLRPALVGGCRPIALGTYLDETIWEVEYRQTTTQWAITSDVLVARRFSEARPPIVPSG